MAADALTIADVDAAERALRDLAAAAESVGVPDAHAWRDTGRVFYTPRALEEVGLLLDRAADALVRAVDAAAAVERDFGFPAIRTATDVQMAGTIAAVLAASPGAPLAVLESELRNAPPADEPLGLIEAGRALERRRTFVEARFTEAALDATHAGDSD